MEPSVRGKGLAIILSSPSGGGKSSLIKALLKLDSRLTHSISFTTRSPRPGEIEGADYYFKSREAFDELARDNQLLESTEIYGNYYGTMREPVEAALNKGADVIFDLDLRGARSLREKIKDSVSIFIMPPSIEMLKERITARGQDSPEAIERRMAAAANEIKHAGEYEYIVVNDNFQTTLNTLCSIIIAERAKKAGAGR